MATADQYANWIVSNAAKKGTPEFDTVAQAYQLAKSEEAASQQQPAPAPQTQSLGDQLLGAGETALTLATGATGGLIGGIVGAGTGMAQQILSGQFGTPEAVRAVEKSAAEGAQALTYQPRGEASRGQLEAIGQALSGLPPVIPMLAAPGQAIQAVRNVAPLAQVTAQRLGGAATQAAGNAAQAIARPIKAATGAVRETFGMDIPAAQTGAVGGRASAGAAATPEALRRVTTAQSLPVPVALTRGAATREASQLAFEKEQMKSAQGGPLRNRAEENNLQALQNFDALVDMTDAQLSDLSSTGGAVVKALTQGLTAAKNKTRAAYKDAKNAGELEENVTLQKVVDYINENIPEGDLAPVLKAARAKAIAVGAAVDDGGKLIAQPVTLEQAENLRKTFQRAGYEGADQYHGGGLRRVFDGETDGLGGDLYKKARAINTQMARKFYNRITVARLVKNRKGMEDPMVAADQVFRKSVLGASPEEITFLKRVLLTSGKDGQQAFKELQGATVRHLRKEATKGMGMDSNDRDLVSPAKLNEAVRALDENERLDVILGKKNAAIVRDLNDVVRYVTTVPPGTLVNSSGTAGTLLAAMTEAGATGMLTGLPIPIASGITQIIKMRKEGKTKARINDALNALPIAQP